MENKFATRLGKVNKKIRGVGVSVVGGDLVRLKKEVQGMRAGVEKTISETEEKRGLVRKCRKLYEEKLKAIDERAREEAQTGIEKERHLRGTQKEIEQLEKEKREVEGELQGS